MNKSLWQIYVPVYDNNGNKIPVSYHQKWDDIISDIAGGLTINKKSRGIWASQTGTIFKEEMIPVLVNCSYNEMNVIAELTIRHYDQEAVMYYKVTDEIFIKRKSHYGD